MFNDISDMMYELNKRGKIYSLTLENGITRANHPFYVINSIKEDVDESDVDISCLQYKICDLLKFSYKTEEYFKDEIASISNFIENVIKNIKKESSDLQNELSEVLKFSRSKEFYDFVYTVSDWKHKGKKEKRSFVQTYSLYEDDFIRTMKSFPLFYDEYDVELVEDMFRLIKKDVENS